ncbi:hypothetical protein ACFQY4_37300 [Catellatospora bangladeshensis]|uniref:hypothetical protein n=1 Tax=Catellatospora bangladeshensis TaxID=310355 RepID=UPI00361A65A3
MPLNSGQPDATTPGLFPIPPGPAREKLRQKYRALTDAVQRVWIATVRSDVELHPGHFHLDCEQVVNDTAAALAAARTIDTLFVELLSGPDRARYVQMWTDDPDGRVVRGSCWSATLRSTPTRRSRWARPASSAGSARTGGGSSRSGTSTVTCPRDPEGVRRTRPHQEPTTDTGTRSAVGW